MPTHPSARELTNAALGKKLSAKAQAAIDDICSGFPADPPDACDDTDDNTTVPTDTKVTIPGNREDHPESSDNDPADRLTRKRTLLQLIDEKIAEAITKEPSEPKPTPRTRAEANRENSAHSTGPKTAEGKAKVSANALKTGFFAGVDRLNPQDSPSYLDALDDLRLGLHPDGPVEEMLIRELATFRARLLRIEATEYALLCAGMDTNTGDAREIAAAYLNNSEALEKLQKAEVHLRRAYNRTWDRLERMQKERRQMPLDEALKQTQINATYEAIRTNRPQDVPARHPAIEEKGKLIKHEQGDPMFRPKEGDENDGSKDSVDRKPTL